MKRLETTRKYLQWKMQRKNHKSRRGRFTVQPTPTRPHWWPTNRRKIVEVLLKEWGIWAPHWAPKSRGLMVRKQTLRMFVFEGQWGLLSGDPEGYGNRDSTLKEHTQNLTVVETQSKKLKRAWWDLPSNCGESPREATGNGSSSWGHRHRWWAFQEPLLPRGHCCWWASFWNPPSSLLASPWPGLAQRAVDTNTRMPQVMQLAGKNPTHQQTGCLKTFWPYSCPGHGPAHKMGQDIAPHSIAQILDPGPPGPCSQRSRHSSIREQAPIPESPGPQPCPQLSLFTLQDQPYPPAGRH